MHRVDLIIPVYNEASNLGELFKRLESVKNSIDIAKIKVLFVDDHSSDGSDVIIRDWCCCNSDYGYIRLARNSGSHYAILAGVRQSKADCSIFLASDLQDPPELISKMIEAWSHGNLVVWAARQERLGTDFFERAFSELFFAILNRLSDAKFPPKGADFALIDQKVMIVLNHINAANFSLIAEINRLGLKSSWIPYVKQPRYSGKTKWNLDRKLKAFADAVVSLSYKPLRYMSYAGIIVSLLGFIYAFFVSIMWLFTTNPVEGRASIMIAVLVMGGFQMIMLGVLGEYLWRTLEEIRRQPPYMIEDSFLPEGFKSARKKSLRG